MIFYLCDGKACNGTCPEPDCYYTTNISHARNFVPIDDENNTDIWEKYDLSLLLEKYGKAAVYSAIDEMAKKYEEEGKL